jgi:glycerol uptake facilitator-like aquaporin
MFSRAKLGVLFAEAVGTAVLTMSLLTLSNSSLPFPYFVAIGLGLTLGMLVLTLGEVSGALFNPAVTIGLWTVKKIASLQAIVYIVAQVVGALGAWRLFEYLHREAITSIADKTFDWHVLVAEAVGTFVLAFGITAVITRKYEGLIAAATIGGSLFLGVTLASVASNGVLNPAVAYGVQSVSKSYVLGPVIGAVLGANVYVLLFAPEAALKAKVAKQVVAEPKVATKKVAKKKTVAKKKK